MSSWESLQELEALLLHASLPPWEPELAVAAFLCHVAAAPASSPSCSCSSPGAANRSLFGPLSAASPVPAGSLCPAHRSAHGTFFQAFQWFLGILLLFPARTLTLKLPRSCAASAIWDQEVLPPRLTVTSCSHCSQVSAGHKTLFLDPRRCLSAWGI